MVISIGVILTHRKSLCVPKCSRISQRNFFLYLNDIITFRCIPSFSLKTFTSRIDFPIFLFKIRLISLSRISISAPHFITWKYKSSSSYGLRNILIYSQITSISLFLASCLISCLLFLLDPNIIINNHCHFYLFFNNFNTYL